MSTKRKAPGGGGGEKGGGSSGGSKRKVRFRQKEEIEGEGVGELRKDGRKDHLRFVAIEHLTFLLGKWLWLHVARTVQ